VTRNSGIFVGPAAIVLMVFYYFIPFAIVAGGPDFLAKLRPFVISSSVLLIAFGFYRSWRVKRSKLPPNKFGLPVLWFSTIVVVGMILFPQTIANVLATLAQ